MKKFFEKHGRVKGIGSCLSLLGFLLVIVSLIVFAITEKSSVKLTLDIIGCLMVLVGLFMIALESKEHRLFKMLGVFILSALIFTWILPYGYFQGTDFYDYGMSRVSFADFGTALYHSVYFSMDKIVFLLVLGGFYGALSVTSGYKSLVTSIAKKLKKYEIVSAVVISLVIVALTSLLSQTFAVLIFIPFFVSILSQMKIDKLSIFAITFGSMLVGMLGFTYGSESLSFFNRYLGTDLTLAMGYRAIILAISFVLYNFFIVMRLRKVLNDKNNELLEDPFVVEDTKKKVSKIPAIIVLSIVAVMVILGFVSWSTNWNISIFTDFHKWLTELKLFEGNAGFEKVFGEDFTIVSYLLGGNAVAFGNFDLMAVMAVLLVGSIVLALVYRVKLAEYLDGVYNGIKKMVKPILLLMGIYFLFVVCYMSPFVPTLTNWILGLTKSFNPFTTSIAAFIASAFHVDFGYTAYSVGSYLTTAYAGDLSIVHAIYTSMYGVVQVLLPTSLALMIGLSLLKVDYKSWLKYIWLFIVGILVILLVLFTVVTYM